jgi:hypothetical protein
LYDGDVDAEELGTYKKEKEKCPKAISLAAEEAC